MNNLIKYYAFLSYCHEDALVAETLFKRLEGFRLPRGVNNICIQSNRLQPIYRQEIKERKGALSDQIHESLTHSKCLLLICSPQAAKSECVNLEVKHFIAEGRVKQIIPYIVAGVPMSGDRRECFPPALIEYFKENPSHELLGIDAQKLSMKTAFYCVVSALLEIPYNKLWDRLARMRRNTMSYIAAFFVVSCALLYYLAAPYTVIIHLHDSNHRLPILKDAEGHVGVVRIQNVEIPLLSLDTVIVSPKLPGFLRGRTASISFSAPYYVSLSDTITFNFGLHSSVELNLKRDDEFEVFSGRVWDLDTGNPIPSAWVDVDGGKYWALTDSAGCFLLRFSLEEQTEIKPISVKAQGYEDYFDDEAVIDRDVPFALKKKI